MNQEIEPPNTYQIPVCTICLRHLSSDIFNLGCGHVFHLACIGQHFEYKLSCPNCQKRSTNRELRPVIYNVLAVASNDVLGKLLKNLNASEKQPINAMIQQISLLTESRNKYDERNKKLTNEMKQLKHMYEQQHANHAKYKKQYQAMKKQFTVVSKYKDSLQEENKRINQQIIEARIKIDATRKKQQEMENFQKYKKIVAKSLEDLLKYKNQLELQVSAEDRSQIFFEMLQITKLEVIKLKEKLHDQPNQLSDMERNIYRLSDRIEKYKKELQESREVKIQERKKYQQLKNKYRNLQEKYKKENLDYAPEHQDSQGYDSRIGQIIKQIQLKNQIVDKKPIQNNQSYGGFNMNNKKKPQPIQRTLFQKVIKKDKIES